jgi:hypothetical protein
VQSVPFSKATRYRRPDWITFYAFRNTSDPRDVAITDRRQNAPLPTDARWTYYATFASPLKAAVAFGVCDIRQLRQHVHARGFQRVRVAVVKVMLALASLREGQSVAGARLTLGKVQFVAPEESKESK